MCGATPLKEFLMQNLLQMQQCKVTMEDSSSSTTTSTDEPVSSTRNKKKKLSNKTSALLHVTIQSDNPASRPLSPQVRDQLFNRRLRSQSCGLISTGWERRRRQCRWESSTTSSSSSSSSTPSTANNRSWNTTRTSGQHQDEEASSRSRDTGASVPASASGPGFRRMSTYPIATNSSSNSSSNASPPRRPQRRSSTSVSPNSSPVASDSSSSNRKRISRRMRTLKANADAVAISTL